MLKKQLIFSGFLFLILSCSSVFADGLITPKGPYLSGNIGVCFLDGAHLNDPSFTASAEFDKGFGLMGAIGYDFGRIRAEAEVGYRKNNVQDFSTGGTVVAGEGDFSAISVMANGFLDFGNYKTFTPYIMAGFGFAEISTNDVTMIGSEDDTVFAYQFGVGLEYALNESLSLEASYRYFATPDPSFDTTDSEYSSHNILFGLRYAFKID